MRTFIVVLALFFFGCSKTPSYPARGMLVDKQLSPEQVEEVMSNATTPGAAHRLLDPLVGKYTVLSKLWMNPGERPEVSTGSAEFSWILDRHFIHEQYSGTFGGKPFKGGALIGHNNVTGKYQSVWGDSMMTGLMLSEGKADDTGAIIRLSGASTCPVKGPMTTREILTIGKDTHVYEMFQKYGEGPEYKALEVIYSRVVEQPREIKSVKPYAD